MPQHQPLLPLDAPMHNRVAVTVYIDDDAGAVRKAKPSAVDAGTKENQPDIAARYLYGEAEVVHLPVSVKLYAAGIAVKSPLPPRSCALAYARLSQFSLLPSFPLPPTAFLLISITALSSIILTV